MKQAVSNETKARVVELRRRFSIREVAEQTALPVGTVKTICGRSGMFRDNERLRALHLATDPTRRRESSGRAGNTCAKGRNRRQRGRRGAVAPGVHRDRSGGTDRFGADERERLRHRFRNWRNATPRSSEKRIPATFSRRFARSGLLNLKSWQKSQEKSRVAA